MLQQTPEIILNSQAMRPRNSQTLYSNSQNHIKQQQDQSAYISQPNRQQPPSPQLSGGKRFLNFKAQNVAKFSSSLNTSDPISSNIDSFSKKRAESGNFSIFHRNSIGSINEDYQTDQQTDYEQKIQNLEDSAQEMTNQVNEKDAHIDSISKLYFQQQEVSAKQNQKIIQLNQEKLDLIEELKQFKLNDPNNKLSKDYTTLQKIHNECGQKIGKLQYSHEVQLDTYVQQNHQLQVQMLDRDQQIKDLTDKIEYYEHQSRLKESYPPLIHGTSNDFITGISGSSNIFTLLVNQDWDHKSIGLNPSLASSNEGTSKNDQKKLLKKISEKNNIILDQSEQITMMQETQNKLIKAQTESNVEMRRQRELFNQLKSENTKLYQQSIQHQSETPKKIVQDNEELKRSNSDLQDKLKKNQIRLDELQTNDEHVPSFNHWNPEHKAKEISFGKYHSTKQDSNSLKSKFQSSQMKTPSVNSHGSTMTVMRRRMVDQFKKETSFGATRILNQHELMNSQIHADQLSGPILDLSQIIERKDEN